MSFPNSSSWTDPPSSSQRSIGWKTTATAFRSSRPDNGWGSQLGSDSLPRSIPRIGRVPSFSFNTPPLNDEDKATAQFQQGELAARVDSRLEGIASGIRANRKVLESKTEQAVSMNQKNVAGLKEEIRKLSKEMMKENQKTVAISRDLVKKNIDELLKSKHFVKKGNEDLLKSVHCVSRSVAELSKSIKQQQLENKRTRQSVENLSARMLQVENTVNTFTSLERDRKRLKIDYDATKKDCESEPVQDTLTFYKLWDNYNQEDETKKTHQKQPAKCGDTSSRYSSETECGDNPSTQVRPPSAKALRLPSSGEDSLFTEIPKNSGDVLDLTNESQFRKMTPTIRRRWRKN